MLPFGYKLDKVKPSLQLVNHFITANEDHDIANGKRLKIHTEKQTITKNIKQTLTKLYLKRLLS